MNRLFTRPALPNALVPTMAIELGIPAVAGPAYFAVAGRTVSFVACALGGYAVLMALAQVRLIPVYRRLSFTPGAWSFAFAYAAAAADALVWLAIKKPPASSGYAIAVIALLTAFVSWIAFRTLVLAVRGQFFPARLPAASPSARMSRTREPVRPLRAMTGVITGIRRVMHDTTEPGRGWSLRGRGRRGRYSAFPA
jgi:tellurite resistance protein